MLILCAAGAQFKDATGQAGKEEKRDWSELDGDRAGALAAYQSLSEFGAHPGGDPASVDPTP